MGYEIFPRVPTQPPVAVHSYRHKQLPCVSFTRFNLFQLKYPFVVLAIWIGHSIDPKRNSVSTVFFHGTTNRLHHLY